MVSKAESALESYSIHKEIDTETMSECVTRSDNTLIVYYKDKTNYVTYKDDTVFIKNQNNNTLEIKHKDYLKLLEFTKESPSNEAIVNLLIRISENSKVKK